MKRTSPGVIARLLPALTAGLLLLSACNFPTVGSNLTPSPTSILTEQTGTPTAAATLVGATATPAALATSTSTPLAAVSLPTDTPQVVSQPTDTPQVAVPPTDTPQPVVQPTDTPQAAIQPTNTPQAAVQPTDTPQPVSQATATPSANQVSIPVTGTVKAVTFPQGATSYVVTVTLTQGAPQSLSVQTLANQALNIVMNGNASMQIYGPDLKAQTGVLLTPGPVTLAPTQAGAYTIALEGVGDVTLGFYIPTPGTQNPPQAPVTAAPQTIQFPSGGTSTTLSLTMQPANPAAYFLTAKAGQQLTVNTTSNVTVALLDTNGRDAVIPVEWGRGVEIFVLPASGRYTLVLQGDGAVSAVIAVPTASALPTAIPLPGSPTRVTIATGNASVSFNASLAAGQPVAYVLTVQAGQILYVSSSDTTVGVSIYGPDNSALVTSHALFSNRWSAPAATSGDYTVVVSGGGPTTLTFYVPPVK